MKQKRCVYKFLMCLWELISGTVKRQFKLIDQSGANTMRTKHASRLAAQSRRTLRGWQDPQIALVRLWGSCRNGSVAHSGYGYVEAGRNLSPADIIRKGIAYRSKEASLRRRKPRRPANTEGAARCIKRIRYNIKEVTRLML